MTPADRLRAAAQKILDMAEKATPAPFAWRVGEAINSEVWAPRDAADFDAFMVATTLTRLNPQPSAQSQADAAWIALLGPDKAGYLANWLRLDALIMDGVDYRGDADDPAIAFADAILGGDA